MTLFYGMRRLGKPEDWQGLAGPDNWVEEHSAFELAYAWQRAGGFPRDVREAFESSAIAALSGLVLETAIVEKPVSLDTLIGPSMNDLMAYARNRKRDRIVIAVEGKAKETFGEPVAAWSRGDGEAMPNAQPKPTRVRRLQFLAAQLGIDIDPDSPLRYQLFHRTASAILEGALHDAVAVVVLVHSFGSSESDSQNWRDYKAFLSAFGVGEPEKGGVSGPAIRSDSAGIPLYFLWVSSMPSGVTAPASAAHIGETAVSE